MHFENKFFTTFVTKRLHIKSDYTTYLTFNYFLSYNEFMYIL